MSAIPEGLAAALADRYRLERELGAGGMATVYLAEDLKHHRQVAIKVLRPDLAASLGAERFLREVGIAARLSHPHILGLHDSGEANGFLYYVMPYVEGISLRQKLQREGELPIPEAVRVLRDIADALAHAHRQGVVHRDIKPENVMLVERHALVMDFGVAKALAEGKEEGSSSLTSAGVALGTPAYMAPEQASGEGHVDARADLYAWGIVAYELLAGQPPFIRATPQNTLAAQVTATPEPVSHHRTNVPGALARLVMQCLEKKPADRPQTAEEVLRQLDQVLTPSGGMTPTDTRPYQTAASRRARQRTLLTGAAVVVGLAVIGVLGWRWWQNHGVPIVADRVVIAPFRNETGKGDLANLGWRIAEHISGMVSREGASEPVPAATVRGLLGESPILAGEALRRLARQTGASLVVSGGYYARGDSVEVRTELLRMRDGTTLNAFTLVVSVNPDAKALDRIAEPVALALLLTRDWGDDAGWGRDYRMPASLAAYRELSKIWFGDVQAFGTAQGSEQAIAIADRAQAMDSTWPAPRREKIWQLAAKDRDTLLAHELVRSRDYLPGDRDLLEDQTGWFAQDFERSYLVAKRRAERHQPQGSLARHTFPDWRVLITAYLTRRWSEVVRLGGGRHEVSASSRRRGSITPDAGGAVHDLLDKALHALGRYKEELKLAQEIETEHDRPSAMAYLIRANAGLRRVEDVERLVVESQGAATGLDPDAGRVAAYELRAHGEMEASRRLCGRLVDQFSAQSAKAEGITYRIDVLNCAGRLPDAIALARHLADSAAETLEGLGYGGLYEARAGNRDTARARVARLLALPKPEDDPVWGSHAWALMVFTALGDTSQALQQLREAYQAGEWGVLNYNLYHMELDLEPIRSHPAAIAMMRPKE